MGYFKLIGQLFEVAFFFLSLWTEKNKKKAEEKAAIAREIVDAFKETNKARRASYLSAAIVKLRK